MATRYIHEFSSLANFNMASRDKPNTVAVGAVSNVLYNGLSSAATPVVQNWEFRTQDLSKTIRLNSQTDSATASGTLIGFQSKPRIGITGSQTVVGCEISAQISSGIALTGSGSVIGAHVDVYVRGTAAGTIAGDVRGMQIELTTDDAGVRDISGYVTALRIRKVFSAGTVTGVQSAIRVEVPEAQTNSEPYTGLFDLTSTHGSGASMVWSDAGVSSATNAGVIGVFVNGNKRYINLFSGTPS
jgi:hypothetical protein